MAGSVSFEQTDEENQQTRNENRAAGQLEADNHEQRAADQEDRPPAAPDDPGEPPDADDREQRAGTEPPLEPPGERDSRRLGHRIDRLRPGTDSIQPGSGAAVAFSSQPPSPTGRGSVRLLLYVYPIIRFRPLGNVPGARRIQRQGPGDPARRPAGSVLTGDPATGAAPRRGPRLDVRRRAAWLRRHDRGKCKGPPPDCRQIVIRMRYGVKGGCDRGTTSTGEGLVNVHAKPPLTPPLLRIDRQQSVRWGEEAAHKNRSRGAGRARSCPIGQSSGVSHGHQRTAGHPL